MDWPFIINLSNSIVSVSFLAMPYCMKQCGVVLGSLLLAASAMLGRIACDLLLRAAQANRMRTYELLALSTFGTPGKFLVELCISALLLFGGCVAYLVVIGDVVPVLVADIFGWELTWSLRAAVLVILAFTVALPLSLMKNIENLHGTSTMSFFFYISFAVVMLFFASSNLASGAWASNTVMWDTSGVFHTIPIFSLSFMCQTQLFLLYNSLPDPSMKKMINVVDYSTFLVALIYLTVGLFGYLAFTSSVSGDVLTNFGESLIAVVMKCGFCVSALVSYPVFVFPSRSSIHSLIFPQKSDGLGGLVAYLSRALVLNSHRLLLLDILREQKNRTATAEAFPTSANYIPHNRFVNITLGIVLFTVIVAIFMPNVETVLGLTGASAGTAVCYLLPGLMFLRSNSSDNTRRCRAKSLAVVGMICLVASTYSVLSEAELSFQTETHAVKDDPQGPQTDEYVDQPVNRLEPLDKMADQADAIDPGGQHHDEAINNQDQKTIDDDIDELHNDLKATAQPDSDVNKDKQQNENQDDKEGEKDNELNERKGETLDDKEKNKVRAADEKLELEGEKRLEPPAPQAPDEVNEKAVQMDTKEHQGKTSDDMANVDNQHKTVKPDDKKAQLAALEVEKVGRKTQMDETKQESRVLTSNRDLKTADQKDDTKTHNQKDNTEIQKVNAVKSVDKRAEDAKKGHKPDVQAMDSKKVAAIKETGNDGGITERKKRVNPVTEGRDQPRKQTISLKPQPVEGVNPLEIQDEHGKEQETKPKETARDSKIDDVEKEALR